MSLRLAEKIRKFASELGFRRIFCHKLSKLSKFKMLSPKISKKRKSNKMFNVKMRRKMN